MPTKRKYRNIPTVFDGVTFASKKEARRYQELKLLERAGEITGLELQPKWPLVVNGVGIAKYHGDFAYRDNKHRMEINGKLIVEDVKSTATKTPVYKLKKKLMKAIYGIDIKEV